ncbi:hypothetical protein [Persicobacter diffluens]|uniref:Zinc-finger domain-containing protein n=1 Tax=Persicobacter diffluens TaxID=981 RepID=A0AAN4VV95_9BACT|nr:hypothetical protein PEDI_13160 [Persicobacter diffluens]
MNADEKYFHMVDDYLSHQLNPEEVLRFEQAMKNSPDLTEEVNFQKDVRNALHDFRKSELKGRLNNLPIKESTYTSGFWSFPRAAAIVSIGLVIGAGFFFSDQLQAPHSSETVSEEFIPLTSVEKNVDLDFSEALESDMAEPKVQPKATETHKEEIRLNLNNTKTLPTEAPKRTIRKPIQPTVTENLEMVESPSSVSVQSAESTEVTGFTTVTLKIHSQKKKHRKYSFQNNQLDLYGQFEKVEFISKTDQLIKLRIDGNTYQLKESPNITELK